MTVSKTKRRKWKSAQMPAEYDVGYGKPPAEHRFKPGDPRINRGGRKKGSVNRPARNPLEERLRALILEEADREVTVPDGKGGKIKMPIARAVVRTLSIQAASGDHRAQELYLETLASAEAAQKQETAEALEFYGEYMSYWEQTFEKYDKAGQPRPSPLPHPDDIEINPNTGDVQITGPKDPAEKRAWENLSAMRVQYAAMLEVAEKDLLREDLSSGLKMSVLMRLRDLREHLGHIDKKTFGKLRPKEPAFPALMMAKIEQFEAERRAYYPVPAPGPAAHSDEAAAASTEKKS